MTPLHTLYHAERACSLASIIAAHEADIPLNIVKVDLNNGRLEDGSSFFKINPLGQVSTLQLTDGSLVTETSTVLVWLQTHAVNPDFRLNPTSAEYFQMLRWIGYCATEIHKQLFRIVFYDEATKEVKDNFRNLSLSRFEWLDQHLAGSEYLVGSKFSAADAYLTWALTLTDKAGVDVSIYKNLSLYKETMHARPKVRENLLQDGAI